MDTEIPDMVAHACQRAERAGFTMSCEPGAGRLLSLLAAAVPVGGRILEIGTGAGVGTAWIVSGLIDRADVEVVTVEKEPDTARIAMDGFWPPFVQLVVGDVLTVFDGLGCFSLIFADAQGGKWFGLERTIAALDPGGVLIVDDMEPASWSLPDQASRTREVRQALLANDDLVCAELHTSSGIILCTRRRDSVGRSSRQTLGYHNQERRVHRHDM